MDLHNLLKYLMEGAAVAIAAFYIPKKKNNIKEIIMIALTAAAVFAVLDKFAPNIAIGTRQGSGFGIGYNMVGGAKIPLPYTISTTALVADTSNRLNYIGTINGAKISAPMCKQDPDDEGPLDNKCWWKGGIYVKS